MADIDGWEPLDPAASEIGLVHFTERVARTRQTAKHDLVPALGETLYQPPDGALGAAVTVDRKTRGMCDSNFHSGTSSQ